MIKIQQLCLSISLPTALNKQAPSFFIFLTTNPQSFFSTCSKSCSFCVRHLMVKQLIISHLLQCHGRSAQSCSRTLQNCCSHSVWSWMAPSPISTGMILLRLALDRGRRHVVFYFSAGSPEKGKTPHSRKSNHQVFVCSVNWAFPQSGPADEHRHLDIWHSSIRCQNLSLTCERCGLYSEPFSSAK